MRHSKVNVREEMDKLGLDLYSTKASREDWKKIVDIYERHKGVKLDCPGCIKATIIRHLKREYEKGS